MTAPPPLGAAHEKLAVLPLTLTARAVGAPCGGLDCGSVTVTAADSGAGPKLFEARTVCDYEPFGAAMFRPMALPIATEATTLRSW